MNENVNRKLLVQRYAENNCTPEELEIFFFLLKKGELDEYLNEDMNQVLQDEELSNTAIPPKKPNVWLRYAMAAAIIVAIATVTWLKLDNSGSKTEPVLVKFQTDIQAPTQHRAMLKLSNGQTVFLDSTGNGVLANQGNVRIEKTADGGLIYRGSSKELLLNTLTNPRGSKVINLKLSDGSIVWLNAGSSIEYPVAFIGEKREVTISGEAYFEVARNPLKPFVARVNEMHVEVLGTHFNINAYADEPIIRTTLLEGRVKVSKAIQAITLKPGQQANLMQNEEIRLIENADIEQVMAWKNGLFQFRNDDIRAVMRQLACWYDVEVVYEGEVPRDKFGGNLPRDADLSAILRALDQSQVHFRIDGKKIIVEP